MTIKELCEKHGLGQTALARRFGIPLRGVQDWYRGLRVPPDYLVRMMDELLQKENDGGDERESSEWEFIKEPNTVDTLGQPVYFARCKKCGFVWTNLYAVKNHFRSCPGCGAKMRGRMAEACRT